MYEVDWDSLFDGTERDIIVAYLRKEAESLEANGESVGAFALVSVALDIEAGKHLEVKSKTEPNLGNN